MTSIPNTFSSQEYISPSCTWNYCYNSLLRTFIPYVSLVNKISHVIILMKNPICTFAYTLIVIFPFKIRYFVCYECNSVWFFNKNELLGAIT